MLSGFNRVLRKKRRVEPKRRDVWVSSS